MRRVTANKSVSHFRTRRAREAAALAKLRPRESYLPRLAAEDAHFWKAVRSLPRRQAQAIALFYLEDRPVAEIAEVLGASESTVKVHLHNARQTLARKLRDEVIE